MKAPISAMAAEAGYDKLSEGRRLISAQRFLKAGRIRREESEALNPMSNQGRSRLGLGYQCIMSTGGS